MRWQFSPRLTSLIVLAIVSLAVGGVTLGLALARGGSADTPDRVAAHMDKADVKSESKTKSRMIERGERKHYSDHDKQAERKRDTDRIHQGKDRRGRFDGWWGSRRVVVAPPRFFRGDSQRAPRVEHFRPERRSVQPGGMVIAVGEITAVHDDVIEMFTVLGNEVIIDLSHIEADIEPEVGAVAIVIAERDGDSYIARSLDLLDEHLFEVLEGLRERSRSAP